MADLFCRLGPGTADAHRGWQVRLVTHNYLEEVQDSNVIGIIRGEVEPDRYSSPLFLCSVQVRVAVQPQGRLGLRGCGPFQVFLPLLPVSPLPVARPCCWRWPDYWVT